MPSLALPLQAGGSIWPSVLFHATHNMAIISVYTQLLAPSPAHPEALRFFAGESSAYQIAAYVVVAAALWQRSNGKTSLCLCLPGAPPDRPPGAAAGPPGGCADTMADTAGPAAAHAAAVARNAAQ